MENFLYTNNYSLSKELCIDIIKYYEEEKDKHYKGITAGGVNINIKDTTDYLIDIKSDKNSKWGKILHILVKELSKNTIDYLRELSKNDEYSKYTISNNKYKILDHNLIGQTFQIQKYVKGIGKYIYHNDFSVKWDENAYRVITYLWYLNDIEEGGETEVLGNYKIKPEAGKILLFPSSWTFPHCGNKPISEDKYIITGWLYVNK
jgi:hypothetical protein